MFLYFLSVTYPSKEMLMYMYQFILTFEIGFVNSLEQREQLVRVPILFPLGTRRLSWDPTPL